MRGGLITALVALAWWGTAAHANPKREQLRGVVLINALSASNTNQSVVGSGFVVAPGKVVTNAHVVLEAGYDRYLVVAPPNTAYPARLLWSDTEADLALLDVPGLPNPAIALASAAPEQGDPVWAAGFPGVSLQWQQGNDTVVMALTTGIVSSEYPMQLGQGGGKVDTIIHSAAISQGNSGGPLLNTCGQVVGVNTAIPTKAEAIYIASASQVLRARLMQASLGVTLETGPACGPTPSPTPTPTPTPSGTPTATPSPAPAPAPSANLGEMLPYAGGLAVALLGAVAAVAAFRARGRSDKPSAGGSSAGPTPTSPLPGSLRTLVLTPVGGGTSVRVPTADLGRRAGVVLGRARRFVDHCIDDPTLSRRHLRLRASDGGVVAEDLGSSNGSAVEGVSLKPFEPVELRRGNRIRLAQKEFSVSFEQSDS